MTKYEQVYYDLIKDGMHPYSAAGEAYLSRGGDERVANVTMNSFNDIKPGENTIDRAQQLHYHNQAFLLFTFGCPVEDIPWGKTPIKPECKHEWVETMGLLKVYRDCKLCGAKDDT